nr:hypothetical protein [Tanacetum cinerariifolium]
LQGLAQAHVVGQHAADFQLAQGLHPAQPFQLIRPQSGVETFRNRDLGVLDVDEPFGKLTDPVAALPQQRHGVERLEPRRVGGAQANRGVAVFTPVEVAQRGEHGLQATVGQGDLNRHAATLGEVVELHQKLFVITPFGDAVQRHQFGVRAQQVDQDRQQAQALAIDDDAQLQVEPVALRFFIDRGVPVVHGCHVKAEIGVHFDLPALLAQRG